MIHKRSTGLERMENHTSLQTWDLQYPFIQAQKHTYEIKTPPHPTFNKNKTCIFSGYDDKRRK